MARLGLYMVWGLVLLLGLGGCARPPRPPAEEIVVVQMFSGPEYEAMLPTARHWNEHFAAATRIRVEVTALDRVGYFRKLETQLLAGTPRPDVLHPFSLHLGKLRPWLEPLDPYLADPVVMTAPDGRKLALDAVLPVAMRTVKSSDGKLYMLPKDMSEVLLYYRQDLIPQPPETWDEYAALARHFTRSLNPQSPTEYGTAMQGKYEIWTFCAALENLWPYGADLLAPDGKSSGFATPGTVPGLRLFADLARRGVLPPEAVNAEHPETARLIREGKVAMAMQWSAFYQELRDRDRAPAVAGKFALAPPPGVRQPDGSIRRRLYVQTIGLALNRHSLHKTAAARFMAWAALGEGAEIYARGTPVSLGGSSPVTAVWQDEHILDMYPRIRPWVEQYGQALPEHPLLPELLLIGSSWVQRLMSGGVTPEEAAAGLDREINERLRPAAAPSPEAPHGQ